MAVLTGVAFEGTEAAGVIVEALARPEGVVLGVVVGAGAATAGAAEAVGIGVEVLACPVAKVLDAADGAAVVCAGWASVAVGSLVTTAAWLSPSTISVAVTGPSASMCKVARTGAAAGVGVAVGVAAVSAMSDWRRGRCPLAATPAAMTVAASSVVPPTRATCPRSVQRSCRGRDASPLVMSKASVEAEGPEAAGGVGVVSPKLSSLRRTAPSGVTISWQ
ncbi:hypothetical protein FMM08_20045 [Quadrisphaera setariae]|uniref:Uncharacterized protein n=1 Tax=Quadrisphaera setariae TaxID=2593304 RepID=A0A5C8Z310_9ACTN|nr:hypothetical protein FHN55_18340 [Streptomyces sp. NP160]TXR52485.1 hypothetical protein FMM08_20045 [Quadrisphaera setariae]